MFPLRELCVVPARVKPRGDVPFHQPTFRGRGPPRSSLAETVLSPVHTTLVSTLLKHLSLDRLRIEIPSAYRTISAAETTRAPSQGVAPRILTEI